MTTNEINARRSQIGSRLAEAREAAGMTQAAAGAALGVESVTVSRWERGAVDIKGKNLAAAAKLYGVTIDSIARGGNSTVNLGADAVPRDTAEGPPRMLGLPLVNFMMEMDRAGATEEEVELIQIGLAYLEGDRFERCAATLRGLIELRIQERPSPRTRVPIGETGIARRPGQGKPQKQPKTGTG